ncbi:MAG: hypothetical protein K1X83_13240 [Oligoflexia bacterium]|nr:hypothetical protein [Oligoflexia bacterium]
MMFSPDSRPERWQNHDTTCLALKEISSQLILRRALKPMETLPASVEHDVLRAEQALRNGPPPGWKVPPKPIDLIESAFSALEQEDSVGALVHALTGLSCAPHNPILWYVTASAFFNLGSVDASAVLFDHALWIHPGYIAARKELDVIERMQRLKSAGVIPESFDLRHEILPPAEDAPAPAEDTDAADDTLTLQSIRGDFARLAAILADFKSASHVAGVPEIVLETLALNMRALESTDPQTDARHDAEIALTCKNARHLLEARLWPMEALELTLYGLSTNPHSAALWHVVASIYFELGFTDESEQALQHVLWIDSEHAAARSDLQLLDTWRAERMNRRRDERLDIPKQDPNS